MCRILKFFVLVSLWGTLNAFLVDNTGKSGYLRPPAPPTLPAGKFFHEAPFIPGSLTVATSPSSLLQAARDALRYFEIHKTGRQHIVDPDAFRDILSLACVKKTLHFIVQTIQEDQKTGRYRILDPAFLKKHFGCIQWDADWRGAMEHAIKIPRDGRIRLTSYGIVSAHGSHKKTAQQPCGLYYLLDNAIRRKYTKHNILAGALDRPENRNKRRALAWVSRQDLEDALMHGTVLVAFDDGTCKILNVDKHNGIAYDRDEKNILAQERYWFFRELKTSSKGGQQTINRFKKRKNVIFAGDLYHIGLGKLIALEHQNPLTKQKELRLGILADTGGAFINNLYQLDYFGGIFANKRELQSHLKTLPSFTKAMILYKR